MQNKCRLLSSALFLFLICVFHRCAAEMLLDVFAEERGVGEAEEVSHLLDRVVGGAQIIVHVGQRVFLDLLQGRLARMLFADDGEIFR